MSRLLLGALLWLVILGGAAQEVSLSVLSSPKAVEPGDLVTHVFSLVNNSASPLEVALEAALPAGWALVSLPRGLSLPAGEEEVIFLTAVVPGDAPAGEYALYLRVRWEGGEVRAAAQVQVASLAALEVLAPQGEAVLPGEQVSYLFSVVNRGNVVDRVVAEAASAHGWLVTWEPRQLSLAPGERAAVEVSLKVPADAPPGRDLLTFIVRSTVSPGVEASTSLFTRVLPPTPELVSGTHLAELRTKAGMRLEMDLMGPDWGATFDLAALGTVLGGSLYLATTLTSPNAQGWPELEGWSLTYAKDGVKAFGADLNLSLTPLLSVDTQGLGARIDHPWGMEIAFASGREGKSLQTGGKVSFSSGEGEVGMAFVRGYEEGWAGSFFGGWGLEEGLRLRLEGGISHRGSAWDSAVLATVVAERPALFRFQFDAYSVGPAFPTSWPDREGLTLSGRIGAQHLSFRYSIRHFRDDVRRTPSLIPVVTSELSSSLDWDLGLQPVSLFLDFEVSRERQASSLDRRAHRLGFGFSGTAGSAAFLFQVDRELDEDLALGVVTTTYQERWRVWQDRWYISASLEQGAFDGSPDATSGGVELSLGTVGPPPRFGLEWRHARTGGGVTLEVDWATGDGPAWGFSAELAWDDKGDVSGLELGVGFSYTFSWLPPFLPVRGWIAGFVFEDRNGNGTLDEGEEGVPGVVAAADGIRVATNENGEFLFPPLDPGEYTLSLEGLPLGTQPQVELPIPLEVEVARRTVVFIPCIRLGEIRGVVFEDLDQDGKRSVGEPGLAGAMVELVRQGEVLDRLRTDASGGFLFSLLPPGTYAVRLAVGTLPERYELTTPGEVELAVAPDGPLTVAFGAYRPPKPVVITYQPPFADFVWSPERPRAGEEVEFDGTGSVDFDGKIVAYAWDFDGDGRPDAQGPIVHWTFPAPGTYQVSLTVTDDSGQTDTLKLELEVAP